MTRAEFTEIVRLLEACWPRQRIDNDDTLALWWLDLGDVDYDAAVAAVRSLYRTGRDFQPNSAHILGEIADQTEQAPSFGDAWTQILRAIRKHGSSNTQRVIDGLEHPAVARLASMMDIRQLGLAAESDLTTWHAQARERYRGIVADRRRELTHADLPAALPRGEGHEPRPAGSAIRQLVESLQPDAQEPAA